MITLVNEGGKETFVECDRTDNVVSIKQKLAKEISKNEVDLILNDDNGIKLDNNIYIPSGLTRLTYSILQFKSGDIVLNVGDNRFTVPKVLQINPQITISELIHIMKVIGSPEELVVFNDKGMQLSNNTRIQDCNLWNDSEIKICRQVDVVLKLDLLNLTIPEEASRPIQCNINDSIQEVKNKICRKWKMDKEFILFTDNDHLDSGLLIDYMVQNDDRLFFAHMERCDHIKIGRRSKHIGYFKFLKYDIITLTKINFDNNPRLVHMLTMFEEDKYFYIGLELMEKGSLKENFPLKINDEIFHYANQILEGLTYLHGMRIIFRNLKCSSIFLDRNNQVKLSNFHFSKYLNECIGDQVPENATHSKPFEYNWAAPEMFSGHKYGTKIDIWSFVATLIEMVTSRPPFSELISFEVIKEICDVENIKYKLPSECPFWIRNIIGKCLQREPSRRPTADELINILNNDNSSA